MFPSTSAELVRTSQEPAHRKWAPSAMASQQPEPLKVFLQHRIKSIISKEWWDFVVNVNNMNSDHASLLYSVANLCPSFQNFLRTRDKELNYILKKRPQIKPRIFSGSERSDIPIVHVVPTEVPSTLRKSCSAELDQILNELYPDERSIIKRKPRTFGPISKQKRMQNLKKFQLLQAQKEIPIDESTTPTLSKILREDKPCTTVKRPESLSPCTSNRDSKHSIEYTISNYDVNRNKLSLNMKKVKKIIKVKKKIMTYTDNNDKSRTKYLLESETPDLKRDLIKKYRIKKCSVALQRLTWKQIKEIKAKGKVSHSKLLPSSNVIKTLGNNLVTNSDPVPSISLKLCLSKAISIQKVNSPEENSHDQNKTNKEVCQSPTPPIQVNSIIPEECRSKNEEGKICFTSEEVSKSLEIDLPQRELAVLDKISKECDRLLSCSSEPEPKEPDQTTTQQNSSASDNPIQKIKQPSENSSVSPSASKSNELEGIAIKSEPILLKQTLSQVNVIKGNPLVLNGTALKGKDVMNDDEARKCSLSQTVISRANNSLLIKKESVRKIDDEQLKSASYEGKAETSSQLAALLKTPIKEEGSSSSVKKMDDSLLKLHSGSNPIALSKLLCDSVSVLPEKKSQEKEIENQKLPLTVKFPANQKDNVIEQFKSKEELKNVYYHGGIVPLGKSSTSLLEKNIFDKRHIFSLKEKKIKETADSDSSTIKLKEKSIPCNIIESKPVSPLNVLRDSSDVTNKMKEKSIHVDSFIESKPGSPFKGLTTNSTDTTDEAKDKSIQNSVIESKTDGISNELRDSCDTASEPKENSIQISVIESRSLESPLNEVRIEEVIEENSKIVDKTNDITPSTVKTKIAEVTKEKPINAGSPLSENLYLSEENDNEPVIIENSAKGNQDSGVNLQDSSDENTCSLQNFVEEDTEMEEDPEKDDVILVETPLEVIELDSQDEDSDDPVPPIKVKVEQVESAIITIDSEGEAVDSDILTKHKENDSNQINTSDEPLPKRPRLEINMTKMEFDNMNCKVCNASFKTHAEWVEHYDNDVPKCTPNLKVSWESTEQALY